ncbi:MAG: flagellar motor switch protein FliG [Gammaproteobacteria bacterium]|nr:flagellar motor switch protein FliG [Gammaproteobacteria bacterium]
MAEVSEDALADGAASAFELDGITRAAIFAQVLGEDAAAAIFKHLEPREVQRLCAAIKDLQNIPQAHVERAIRGFLDKVDSHSNLGMDSEDYIKRVLIRAHGQEKAAGIIDRIMLGDDARGLDNLKWMDARQVAALVREEHPQVKAIVLSYLEPDHAAAVLSHFTEEMRTDLVLRIATLDPVQPAALRELNAALEKQVSGAKNLQSATVGGVKAAADLLNFMESGLGTEILDQLREHDPQLGQEIEERMFSFDNLKEIEGLAIQTLLREVSSESLLLALKGADAELKEKIFSNMSRRAGEMLRDDLEAKGPVRISDVEMAQREILTIARRLSDEGQIALGPGGADEFI